MRATTTKNPVRLTRFVIEHMWTQRRVSAFIDDELDAHRRARVARHEAECPECRETIESMRRIVKALPLLRKDRSNATEEADRVAAAVAARIPN